MFGLELELESVRVRSCRAYVWHSGAATKTPHACGTRRLRDDLTIDLGPAPLCDVYTRVRAVIQVCGIAVPAPQRPHAGDTRELTSPYQVRVMVRLG